MKRFTKTFQMRLPEQLKDEMDKYCEEKGLTIAELIRQAVREYIQKKKP